MQDSINKQLQEMEQNWLLSPMPAQTYPTNICSHAEGSKACYLVFLLMPCFISSWSLCPNSILFWCLFYGFCWFFFLNGLVPLDLFILTRIMLHIFPLLFHRLNYIHSPIAEYSTAVSLNQKIHKCLTPTVNNLKPFSINLCNNKH